MSNAFVRLYEQNVQDVYAYLVYRVGSHVEAERLTQQTFERAARRWRSLPADSAEERLWLFGIARRLAGVVESAGEREDPGLAGDLANALAQLDPSARSVVALRLGGQLTAPEIARVLGASDDAVRRRLTRSLRRLRTELDGRREGSPPGRAELRREDGGDAEQTEA